MFPPDRHDMSEARRQMLKRRRRALIGLVAASVVLLISAIVFGGPWLWTLGVLTLAGLAGYLVFLRSQARRDRARRQNRRDRASARHPAHDYDATATSIRATQPESAVRIDEDDVALDHLDTVDLTGLYSEVEMRETEVRRAG